MVCFLLYGIVIFKGKKKKQKTFFREQKLEGSIKKINILPAKIKGLEGKSLRFHSIVLWNRK